MGQVFLYRRPVDHRGARCVWAGSCEPGGEPAERGHVPADSTEGHPPDQPGPGPGLDRLAQPRLADALEAHPVVANVDRDTESAGVPHIALVFGLDPATGGGNLELTPRIA